MGLQYGLFKTCHVTIKITLCVPTRHEGLDKSIFFCFFFFDKSIIVDTIHLLNHHFSNHSTSVKYHLKQYNSNFKPHPASVKREYSCVCVMNRGKS